MATSASQSRRCAKSINPFTPTFCNRIAVDAGFVNRSINLKAIGIVTLEVSNTPFPIANLWHVLTFLVDVLFVLYELF